MKKYYSPDSSIHLIVRGLMIDRDGNVILCRLKGKNWFFLPGGHVENGESARKALKRELVEEIDDHGQKVTAFIGVCENVFNHHEDILQHEINFIFQVNLADSNVESREDHIEFIAIRKDDIETTKILPIEIKDGILSWLKTKKPFLNELR